MPRNVEEFQNPDGRHIVTFDGSIDGNLIQIAVLVTENGAKKVESIRLFARPWPVVKLFRQCMERTCVRIRFPTPSGIFQQPMRGDEDVQATGALLGELQSSVSARPASCGCLGCFLLWQA
jgi:hypothetical protein